MKKNKLQDLFPMIQTRQEILAKIQQNKILRRDFYNWEEKYQEEFLDFCSGEKGVKIMYDPFFKEVFNPEYHPERLEEWLSLLLNKKVHILQILPNDSTRIADETSLLITDIVVELEDGSIANVEVQKIGYSFPGQRSACYSADLLLRQYKRVKDTAAEKARREGIKSKFTYKDIKNVYTIVLYESSSAEFKSYPNTFCHMFEQKSNTGLELELLQKYFFIPLDICYQNLHTKDINSIFDAWLLFLSTDSPEDISRLIRKYPKFKAMYQNIYEICRNVEEVVGMFSKELQELDRNTVLYMIDQMQEEKDQLQEKTNQLKEEKNRIKEESDKIKEEKDKAIEELGMKDKEIEELKRQLEAMHKR